MCYTVPDGKQIGIDRMSATDTCVAKHFLQIYVAQKHNIDTLMIFG